jgi:phosphatidylinositol alpha-1,6-mannosyltransferase
VTDAFGGHGGIAQYNRDFLASLTTCDSVGEVIVLPRMSPMLPGTLPDRVRQLAPVKGRIAYSLAAIWAAQAHRPIDIVFCGHIFMTPLAVVIARLLHAPLWVQLHGVDAWDELSILYRRSMETAALVTSVSRYTRQRLLQWVGLDQNRVKVLPCTVDPRFQPGPKPCSLVERYAASEQKVLMTVSRLARSDRYKGHDRIIRALQRVLLDHPQTIYIVVGDGDDRPRLEALAEECGVSGRVRFAGQVAAEELVDHYHLADVLVMPSTGEGFGIVFLEAMASGIPVIGGNRDGSLDPLADGEAGTAVDPDDIEALASAICATLRGPTTLTDGPSRFNQKAFAAHVRDLVASRIVADELAVL